MRKQAAAPSCWPMTACRWYTRRKFEAEQPGSSRSSSLHAPQSADAQHATLWGVQMVRGAGGVCVADEVQTGFGRTGSHYWGFQTQVHPIATPSPVVCLSRLQCCALQPTAAASPCLWRPPV